MRGQLTRQTLAGREGWVYLPPRALRSAPCPAVYVFGGEGPLLAQVMGMLEKDFGVSVQPFALVSVPGTDWWDDYSPWPAPALPGPGVFTGGYPKTLAWLLGSVLPEAEARFGLAAGDRTLVGYSLAGLAALSTLYATDAFGGVGCLSGSLWFEGWMDYARTHQPRRLDARVYLSLGREEPRTRNPVMAHVGEDAQAMADLLASQLAQPGWVRMVWNKGGHADGLIGRYERALRALMAMA